MGGFRPLEKVNFEDFETVVNESFGLLKGKNTLKAPRETGR